MTSRARREDVLELLRHVGLGLDDDDIADRLGIDRHYVNALCRQLVGDGLIRREAGAVGKLINSVAPQDVAPTPTGSAALGGSAPSRRRVRRSDRARQNTDELIANFDRCLARFEQGEAFPGPSLYFHERALERRRTHDNAADLLNDDHFMEYVYAVLPAWGMHRMGNQRAKVGGFGDMCASFHRALPTIAALWDRRIVAIAPDDVDEVAGAVWEVISTLQVSTSNTRIVAGSKALHHVLPDLVPPIDRRYTFRFFTGQTNVTFGEQRAFGEWFPYLCEVGRARSREIDQAVERGGFMATGPAKVIDNAIIGFMQLQGVDPEVEDP